MLDPEKKQIIDEAGQELNKSWWESNPMTYEWGGENPHGAHGGARYSNPKPLTTNSLI